VDGAGEVVGAREVVEEKGVPLSRRAKQ